MRKNPTRTWSMRLGGRAVGEGEEDGDGEGVGVARGDGAGVGVGTSVGTGVLTGGVVGLGVGLDVGAGLIGVPAGRFAGTRMRSGRVGSSSVTVQPKAENRANPPIQWDILMRTSLETTLDVCT
jgi:hypothetical protein